MENELKLDKDIGDAEATEKGIGALLGKQGIAISELRPAGVAEIEGQRVDVVTQGGMIAEGDRVRVTKVEGNRVVVEAI